MNNISQWIESSLSLSAGTQAKILSSVILIFILWLFRTLIILFVLKKTDDAKTRYRWRKTSHYLFLFLCIILVSRVWLQGMKSISTFIGLISAGVVIALKDLLINPVSWLFILWNKPFEVGDRIQIGEHRGDVIDIRLYKFTLMEIGNWVDSDQSTGRIIHIPNSLVINETIANYSKGFEYIWNEIKVLVTFESDWKLAKEHLEIIITKHTEHLTKLAQKKVKEASKKFMIFYKTLTPIVYTSVLESGVLLTIRYLCQPRKRRGSEHEIWEDILSDFSTEPTIDFAYPTQRFYKAPIEKPND